MDGEQEKELPASGGPIIQPKLTMQRLCPSARGASCCPVRRTTTSAQVGPIDDTKNPKPIPDTSMPILDVHTPQVIRSMPVRNTAVACTAIPLVLGCCANMLSVNRPPVKIHESLC